MTASPRKPARPDPGLWVYTNSVSTRSLVWARLDGHLQTPQFMLSMRLNVCLGAAKVT